MGNWFTILILDVLRGWIGSSEGGELVRMSQEQIVSFQDMEDRHENERQAFMRSIFRRSLSQGSMD